MENVLLTVLVIALVALGIFGGYAYNKPAEIQFVDVNNTVIIEKSNDTLVNEMASDYLQSKYDEKLQNDTAKALVLEEYARKSFKVALFDLLADEFDIESYKDIEFSSLEIKEVELDGDDAVVTATFKVDFDEFDDSDFTKRATIEVVFEVSGLDVEDLEDSDVEEFNLEVLRVKDLD
jgi:hypothetical protein